MIVLGKSLYMTRAFAEEVPREYKQFLLEYLWKYSEEMTDYLQVFEFYTEGGKEYLRQSQEVPERSRTTAVELPGKVFYTRKIWLMDEGSHRIFLFPEDY